MPPYPTLPEGEPYFYYTAQRELFSVFHLTLSCRIPNNALYCSHLLLCYILIFLDIYSCPIRPILTVFHVQRHDAPLMTPNVIPYLAFRRIRNVMHLLMIHQSPLDLFFHFYAAGLFFLFSFCISKKINTPLAFSIFISIFSSFKYLCVSSFRQRRFGIVFRLLEFVISPLSHSPIACVGNPLPKVHYRLYPFLRVNPKSVSL